MKLKRSLATSLLLVVVMFGSYGCFESKDSGSDEVDSKYMLEDDGIRFYAKSMESGSYGLSPFTDSEFNALSADRRRVVADKLLATLFFGLPQSELDELIESGAFMSTVESNMHKRINRLDEVERALDDNGRDDENRFYFSSWPSGTAEVARILARFYQLEHLDKSYVEFWSAYVLTQNIMFSPATELASSHAPNIERVYSSFVRNIQHEFSIRYSTYMHMFSDDNWRRFRSPEDNGREMMEIFLLNFEDADVPVAAKALKNWRLSRDNDTLVVGVDANSEPLELFGTTVLDGYDFYRELVKDDRFINGVVTRVVDVYFPTYTLSQKQNVIDTIVSSSPASWQDLLLQIVFSQEYLLRSDKPKSVEELFFSLAKKMSFEHRRGFFSTFARSLSDINQASMRYKLGRYVEVPLDTQSFITYHKLIRENLLISSKNSWNSGWVVDRFVPDALFEGISAYEHEKMLDRLIDHLFLSVVARVAFESERALFKTHMLQDDGVFNRYFKIFDTGDNRYDGRIRASTIILDYLSRLTQNYRFVKAEL